MHFRSISYFIFDRQYFLFFWINDMYPRDFLKSLTITNLNILLLINTFQNSFEVREAQKFNPKVKSRKKIKSNWSNICLKTYLKKCDTKKEKLKFDYLYTGIDVKIIQDTFPRKGDRNRIIKPLRGSSTPINIIKPRTGWNDLSVLDRWYSREHEIKRSIIRIYNCRGFLFSSKVKGVGGIAMVGIRFPLSNFGRRSFERRRTLEISDGTNDGIRREELGSVGRRREMARISDRLSSSGRNKEGGGEV